MHFVGWTAAGHPKGRSGSGGAAQRLDAPTAVRHPGTPVPLPAMTNQSGKYARLSPEIIREIRRQTVRETTAWRAVLRSCACRCGRGQRWRSFRALRRHPAGFDGRAWLYARGAVRGAWRGFAGVLRAGVVRWLGVGLVGVVRGAGATWVRGGCAGGSRVCRSRRWTSGRPGGLGALWRVEARRGASRRYAGSVESGGAAP